MTKQIIATLVMGGFNLAGLVIIGFGIRTLVRAWRTTTWQKTTARLLEASVEETVQTSNKRNRLAYEVQVKYEYDAGGRPLNGTTIAHSYMATHQRDQHDQLLETLKSIPHLTVYYDPLEPEKCTLVPGVDGGSFFGLAIGIMWLAVTAGLTGMMLLIQGGDPELIRSISVG